MVEVRSEASSDVLRSLYVGLSRTLRGATGLLSDNLSESDVVHGFVNHGRFRSLRSIARVGWDHALVSDSELEVLSRWLANDTASFSRSVG